jgi:ferritin-like metal-binding protein YciE
MRTFFIHRLQEAYAMEEHNVRFLPTLREVATSRQLKDVLEDHKRTSQEQVKRLRMVFDSLRQPVVRKRSPGYDALIEETRRQFIPPTWPPHVMDVAVVIRARQMTHLEIAGYKRLIPMATLLGYTKTIRWFEMTLEQEHTFDSLLSEIATDRFTLKRLS